MNPKACNCDCCERAAWVEPIRLGDLIAALERRPAEQWVIFDFGRLIPRKLASYRGYYAELALGYDDDWYGREPRHGEGHVTVRALLIELRSAIGKTFTGWKGGDYVMNERTPVWAANTGESPSTAIVGLAGCNYATVLATRWCDR